MTQREGRMAQRAMTMTQRAVIMTQEIQECNDMIIPKYYKYADNTEKISRMIQGCNDTRENRYADT
jgi:hypothetical protein